MSVTISRDYVDQIIEKYSWHFNVYRNEQLGSIPLSFYAEYQRRDEKYFMTKSIPIWGVDNQQYVFTWEKEAKVTEEDVRLFTKELLKNKDRFVVAHQEHMSTVLLGVILTNKPLENETIKEVKRIRKLKFLNFGMGGWIECYVGVVYVPTNESFVHKKGREYMKHFKVN